MIPLKRVTVLALVASLALLSGCPRHGSLTGKGAKTSLPAVRWTVQLEGDPWPWGVQDKNLLVWTYRFAQSGFLFPIKLESYLASSGRSNWSVPIRPWLWSTEVPWSYNATLTPRSVNAWVKGNVARSLSLADGTERWSTPQCSGLVNVGKLLVAASEQTLTVLDAHTGRTLRTITLKAPLIAPPVVAGDRLVGLQEGNHLVGVDPRGGKVTWRVAVGAHGQPDRPIPANDYVLLPHLPTESSAPSSAHEEAVLQVRSASTGALVWSKTFRHRAGGGQASALGSLRVAGELIFLSRRNQRCLVALELASGRQRFERCGLRLTSPPLLHGTMIYVLGDDPRSRAALKKGAPWHAVDFPLVALHHRTGRPRSITLAARRRRQKPRQIRAVRLQIQPIRGDVLYLLQRHRFLTALRIPPAKTRKAK